MVGVYLQSLSLIFQYFASSDRMFVIQLQQCPFRCRIKIIFESDFSFLNISVQTGYRGTADACYYTGTHYFLS